MQTFSRQPTPQFHMSFENFLVGSSNRAAYTAAPNLAECKPPPYKPSYLYGGVGTGKTHLLHAIARRAREKRPSLHIQQLNGDRFMMQFHMSFENFLVGSSNRAAYTAALNLAECKSPLHKPLCLYGGLGTGKTHLLCAIAKRAREKRPSLHIQQLNGDQFMMQMAEAFESKQAPAFRALLRAADLLLIDDLHFLTSAGARMKNEMKRTLDFLLAKDRGVVLTTGTSPEGLRMRDSLHSRLAGESSIEIQPADAKLRLDILHRKASVLLPRPFSPETKEVLAFLAENRRGGAREMEGTLRYILSAASISQQEITLGFAQKTLSELLQASAPRLTIKDIQHRVYKYYGFQISEMDSRPRTHAMTRARHIAMYLCKRLTSSSLDEIGREFGGRGRTTVAHVVDKIKALRREDPKVDTEVTLLQIHVNT